MSLYKTIIVETLRGKSLGRILFNYELKFHKVNGKVLDLGSGNVKPSYYRFLKMEDNTEIITVNISTKMKPSLLADLEKPFPLTDEIFDYILIFNLLEHIYNYRILLNESYRVLKKDGKLYGVVPFLANVHSDPYDYFRFTDTALLRLLKEAGFKDMDIKPLGFGPFVSAYSQIQFLLPRVVRLLSVFICIFLDKLILKFLRTKKPLGYFFVCRKG